MTTTMFTIFFGGILKTKYKTKNSIQNRVNGALFSNQKKRKDLVLSAFLRKISW